MSLNPSQVDLEPIQQVVGFIPYQSMAQLDTQAAHPKGILAGIRPKWEQLHHEGQSLHSDSYMVIEVYPSSQPAGRGNSTHGRANSIQDLKVHIIYKKYFRSTYLKDCTTEPHKISAL